VQGQRKGRNGSSDSQQLDPLTTWTTPLILQRLLIAQMGFSLYFVNKIRGIYMDVNILTIVIIKSGITSVVPS